MRLMFFPHRFGKNGTNCQMNEYLSPMLRGLRSGCIRYINLTYPRDTFNSAAGLSFFRVCNDLHFTFYGIMHYQYFHSSFRFTWYESCGPRKFPVALHVIFQPSIIKLLRMCYSVDAADARSTYGSSVVKQDGTVKLPSTRT